MNGYTLEEFFEQYRNYDDEIEVSDEWDCDLCPFDKECDSIANDIELIDTTYKKACKIIYDREKKKLKLKEILK